MIKGPIKTLEYFKSCLKDPLFEVFEILHNTSHPQYEKLIEDLNNLDEKSLDEYSRKYKIDFWLCGRLERNIEKRARVLIYILQEEIAKERIKTLCDTSDLPKPYNSQNLKNFKIDNDKLVSIENFEIYNGGFLYKDYVYLLPPITKSSNSSYWLTQAIIQLYQDKHINFKIRLDPFWETPKLEFHPIEYKMLVYGKKLDWKRIEGLKQEEIGRFTNIMNLYDYSITEYVWRPQDDEVHFICEEMPKEENILSRGSRFFHAILDKKTRKFLHCDGAIRVYSKSEYNERVKTHIKDPKARKAGQRIKIFQVDEKLDKDSFCLLVVNFFVWNDDIQQYFNNY